MAKTIIIKNGKAEDVREPDPYIERRPGSWFSGASNDVIKGIRDGKPPAFTFPRPIGHPIPTTVRVTTQAPTTTKEPTTTSAATTTKYPTTNLPTTTKAATTTKAPTTTQGATTTVVPTTTRKIPVINLSVTSALTGDSIRVDASGDIVGDFFDFGDGTPYVPASGYRYHAYTVPGAKTIRIVNSSGVPVAGVTPRTVQIASSSTTTAPTTTKATTKSPSTTKATTTLALTTNLPGRSRLHSGYVWEGAVVIDNKWLSDNGYGTSGDVVFNNRSFRSKDPKVAAMTINTNRRITFNNCNFSAFSWSGPGVNGGCVKAVSGQPRIRLYNCIFFGGEGNPMYAGAYAGRAVVAQYCQEIIIEHCEMIRTSGISIQEFFGNKSGSTPTIQIKNNKYIGLNGKISDPLNAASGYYKEGNVWGSGTDSDFVIANLVQMNTVTNTPNIEIAYNEVITDINQDRFEDMVSIYVSSGTPSSPIWLHHNLFRGGYVFDRWFNPNTSTWFGNNMPDGTLGKRDSRGYQNSGGGGLSDGKGKNYTLDCGFILFEDNVILDMSNYGIGIAAGHDMTLRRNKIFRSGYVHGITRDVKIGWRHVPVQIQDYSTRPDNYTYTSEDWANGTGGLMDDGTGTNTKRHRWYNNKAIDNLYGYIYFNPSNGQPGSSGLLINSPLAVNTGNVNLVAGMTGEQAAALITRQYVDNIALQHQNSLTASGIIVGLQ